MPTVAKNLAVVTVCMLYDIKLVNLLCALRDKCICHQFSITASLRDLLLHIVTVKTCL